MSADPKGLAPVLVSIDGSIATLTLNRPAAGNAVVLPLARALLQAAIRCDQDPAIRCVVLTGTGKLFCGGGDIGAFGEGTHRSGAARNLLLASFDGSLEGQLEREARSIAASGATAESQIGRAHV